MTGILAAFQPLPLLREERSLIKSIIYAPYIPLKLCFLKYGVETSTVVHGPTCLTSYVLISCTLAKTNKQTNSKQFKHMSLCILFSKQSSLLIAKKKSFHSVSQTLLFEDRVFGVTPVKNSSDPSIHLGLFDILEITSLYFNGP